MVETHTGFLLTLYDPQTCTLLVLVLVLALLIVVLCVTLVEEHGVLAETPPRKARNIKLLALLVEIFACCVVVVDQNAPRHILLVVKL